MQSRTLCAAAIVPALLFGVPANVHSQSSAPAASSAADERNSATVQGNRASDLIGRDVVNDRREKIAEIEDLVINLNDGEVRYVAVATTAAPHRLYALPLHAFSVPPSGDNALLTGGRFSADRLVKMPSWSRNDWPALDDSGYWAQIDGIGGFPRLEPAEVRFARASQLIGQNVRNRQGAELGHLEDLVVGMHRQRVHYAVLSFDRGILQRDEFFPFPVSRFAVEPDGKGNIDYLVLDVDVPSLQRLSGFPRNDWPLVHREGRESDLQRWLSFRDPRQPNASFDSLDMNRDGYLSRNEAQGDRDAMGRWSTLDRDADDRLSREEFESERSGSASTGQ